MMSESGQKLSGQSVSASASLFYLPIPSHLNKALYASLHCSLESERYGSAADSCLSKMGASSTEVCQDEQHFERLAHSRHGLDELCLLLLYR